MPRRRIAVVTNDVLTTRMAGPAIRAWHMAEVLSKEHDVRLVSTRSECDLTSDTFSVDTASGDQLRKVESWCDILIFQGSVLFEHQFLKFSEKILVVDIYNPMHLETLEVAKDHPTLRRRTEVYNAILIMDEQLLRGDFFLSASPRQRTFWLGHLAALGRVNEKTYDEDPAMRSLVEVVPFGLSEVPPVHRRAAIKGVQPGIGADDKVILWGGGIYNWFDPVTLIRAVDQLRRRRDDVRLYFLGLKHPNPMVPTMRTASDARTVSAELGLTDRFVFFNEGWVPYQDRESYLTEADIGVSTHIEHLETVFSFRTRILDYLWAGLPIVTTEGDFFADLVEREQLGMTVPAGNVDALSEALLRLLDDAELAADCGRRSAEVAKQFNWPLVLDPVVRFCRSPCRAPDLLDADRPSVIEVTEPLRPPSGLIDNLRILLDHWEAGGPQKVANKLASRVRYSFGRGMATGPTERE